MRCCSRPGVQPVPPTPGTPLKGSPVGGDLRRNLRGLQPSPPLPPTGCGWQCQHPGMERVRRVCPPLQLPAVPLLADPGGGDGSRLPPDLPPHRWHGQPAQVALRHGRLGLAACNAPGKGCVPTTAWGQEQSQGPPVTQGVQSRGEHRRQVLGSPRCHARCQIRDFGTGIRVL